MVFFTCSHCGESVRKNKVEKHYQTVCSRNPISVTCVDCCKDFSAETYTAHTKCVSEEEKYSAKGFQPKPSANKGEQKQQKWQDVIQAVREVHRKNLSSNERTILDILVKHENVPRKRVKFQNFLRSMLNRQYNANAADSVFDKIEAESKQDSAMQNDSQKLNESNGEEEFNASVEVAKENITEEQPEEKLSKKEKKEKKKRAKYEAELKEIEAPVEEEQNENERQRKKKSKTEVTVVKENGIEEEKNSKKKNKKRLDEQDLEMNGTVEEEKKSKKKKKKHTEENTEQNYVNEEMSKTEKKILAQENGITEEEGQKKKKKGVVSIEENGITKMDICETEVVDNEQESKKSRKKHKKDVDGEKEKKKRKKDMVEDEEPCKKKAKGVDPEENLAEETNAKAGKSKFNWQEIILQVLSSKEEKEMSLKRLRKKVLAELEFVGCGSATDVKNIAKFNKKVNHIPGVVVLKDTAKLVSVQ